MFAAPYDSVFAIPVESRIARRHAVKRIDYLDEWEFSDLGREPKVSIAWVYLPLLCFWGVVIAFVV